MRTSHILRLLDDWHRAGHDVACVELDYRMLHELFPPQKTDLLTVICLNMADRPLPEDVTSRQLFERWCLEHRLTWSQNPATQRMVVRSVRGGVREAELVWK
jgi:hypothetical protein